MEYRIEEVHILKLQVKLTGKSENKNISDVISYSHDNDCGADIVLQEDVKIYPGSNKIPLGFTMKLPAGVAGFIFPRSSIMGLGLQFNLAPIDPDYSGIWHMIVYNTTSSIIHFKKGTRICQIVLMPYIQAQFVSSLDNIRSENGLGSSGR